MLVSRTVVFIFVLLLVACSGSDPKSLQIGADNPGIRYTGRWNFDDPKEPWVGWQGSTVSVAFRGSGISATFDISEDRETLRVIIDGVPEEPARMTREGQQTIVVASDLDPTVDHVVTLMKEEYATSNFIFQGFTLADGELSKLPPRPEMRIAFFGDSNMEGYSLYNEKK